MTKPTHVYMDTIVKVILFLVMAFHYVSVYETRLAKFINFCVISVNLT